MMLLLLPMMRHQHTQDRMLLLLLLPPKSQPLLLRLFLLRLSLETRRWVGLAALLLLLLLHQLRKGLCLAMLQPTRQQPLPRALGAGLAACLALVLVRQQTRRARLELQGLELLQGLALALQQLQHLVSASPPALATVSAVDLACQAPLVGATRILQR